ncbi:MAG: hypothetical protein AAF547_09130 [Actinomycetota bacterium]
MADTVDADALGRGLADRHLSEQPPAEPDRVRSLLNYAESPHPGDWTLRSALVRLAQPDPARVGRLLETMRRLDAPLQHVARILERHPVVADRALDPSGLGQAPVEPQPDVRTADLARLVAAGADPDGVLRGYDRAMSAAAADPLGAEERLAVPLLVLAVDLDALAVALAAWAEAGPADPPVAQVDATRDRVAARLDELGVPVETGPPPGVGRRRGSGER